MLFLYRISRNIKRYTIEILSLDSMNEKYYTLAVNYIFLMIYATLESVFVNTLLYRVTPDISIVFFYRGITFLVSAIAMYFAAYISHVKSPVVVIRLGGAFYFLMYIFLFFGMDHMDIFMYFAAVSAGIAGAFYWSGHNQLIPHYTLPSNRDVGVSILCIIQGITTLFVPIISGSVISLTEAFFGSTDIGYRVIFGAGMIIVIAQIRYQSKLSPVEQTVRKSEIKLAIKLLIKKNTYKYVMFYETLRGFREGAFGFILNMILFEIITSESLVGLNAFLTGIMAIAGAWVYGRLVKPLLRARYVVISTTIMMIFCASLLITCSAPSVMIFAMINAFFALFILNSAGNSTIDVITQNAVSRKCLGESIAIREVFLTIGRVGGLCVLMIFPSTMTGRVYAMLVLTVTQYLLAWIIGRNTKIIYRKHISTLG